MKKIGKLEIKELMKYVPDIYQKDIYHINYIELKRIGVTTLSFDLDDTITGLTWWIPSRKSIRLFYYLKRLGFRVVILSNASEKRVMHFKKKLNADDAFFKVHKPESFQSWIDLMTKYDINESQLVHIGNSMIDDVFGAHQAGIKAALVRRNGFIVKIYKAFNMIKTFGIGTIGHQIRKQLMSNQLFSKHHLREYDDQYYNNWSDFVNKFDICDFISK